MRIGKKRKRKLKNIFLFILKEKNLKINELTEERK